MKVIDLFCGVGGLSLGLEMAGFNAVLGLEKDEKIAEGYKVNFPKSRCLERDISTLSPEDYREILGDTDIDLIAGGPPCQGFSQKGKRLNLDDERNFLFKYYIDLVDSIKPKAFLIENVPNLLSTSNGYFYKEIQTALKAMGYTVSSKILNAKDYGVPQSRRRAFIIGIRGNTEFTFPTPLKKLVTVEDAIGDLPRLKSGESWDSLGYPNTAYSAFQKQIRKKSTNINNHKSTNHSDIALERLAMIPENGGKEYLPKEHLTKSIYSGTWTRLRSHEQAPTITTRFDTPSSGQFTLPTQDRCLSIREAARLQSFPDWFQFTGTKSTQMLQVGNAVPPLLAKSIGTSLYKQLLELSNNTQEFIAA